MTPTHVETRLRFHQIMKINTLKPWVTFWCIETKRNMRKVYSNVKIGFRQIQ